MLSARTVSKNADEPFDLWAINISNLYKNIICYVWVSYFDLNLKDNLGIPQKLFLPINVGRCKRIFTPQPWSVRRSFGPHEPARTMIRKYFFQVFFKLGWNTL